MNKIGKKYTPPTREHNNNILKIPWDRPLQSYDSLRSIEVRVCDGENARAPKKRFSRKRQRRRLKCRLY